jgi:hypothetical protein
MVPLTVLRLDMNTPHAVSWCQCHPPVASGILYSLKMLAFRFHHPDPFSWWQHADCVIWALLWLKMPPSGSCLKMPIRMIVVYEHSSDSICHHPDPGLRCTSGWLWYMTFPLTQYAIIRILSEYDNHIDCDVSTTLTQDATIRILSQDAHQDDCGIWALLWLKMPPSGSCFKMLIKMIAVYEHSSDSRCPHPDPISTIDAHQDDCGYEHSSDSLCHHPDPVSRWQPYWLWYMSTPLTQDATIRIMSHEAHQDDCGIWALLWLNMPPSGSCLSMPIKMIVVYEHSSDSMCHYQDHVSKWLW